MFKRSHPPVVLQAVFQSLWVPGYFAGNGSFLFQDDDLKWGVMCRPANGDRWYLPSSLQGIQLLVTCIWKLWPNKEQKFYHFRVPTSNHEHRRKPAVVQYFSEVWGLNVAENKKIGRFLQNIRAHVYPMKGAHKSRITSIICS